MAVTLAFQLRVASLLGYRPRLDACASCGGPLAPERWFSAVRGGLLCSSCAAREPGLVRLSADALAGLSLLLSRPLSQASALLEPARSGEVERVVELFLRQHFQRFQGLRALDVLRAIEDAGASGGRDFRRA
jgi:DNA repair protein RecO (recombination protein O)